MADGAMQLAPGAWPAWPRLNQAVLPRSSLWAVCACGREAVIDPKPWVAQGLARQAVSSLETRLRCLCGARRARLEIRGLGEAPENGAG
ncbi:MAG: hypothetical protein JSS35_08085, partial [Proteobacteria bacterium]|nr:hypothetical protein [Pseudomonadota bacterium]